MPRLTCECGQSFASHGLDGRAREICPYCRRPIVQAREAPLQAIIVQNQEGYPYAAVPRSQPTAPVPAPFYVSAKAVAWLSALLVCSVLLWFISAFAAMQYDYAKVVTMIMLGFGLFAAISLLGTGFSVVLRRRLDGQTVFGWLSGAMVGLLTFLLLIWIITRAVTNHRPPPYILPLIPLAAFLFSGITANITSLLMPQALSHGLLISLGIGHRSEQ